MARDRFATRAAILESAAEIVAANGVGGLGVNGLADAAKCDKVLIYRYFGGLDGVLHALGAERMLWPATQLPSAEGDGSLADAVETLVLEEWAALSSGALMLEAAAAETISASALGSATAVQRSERREAMIAALREHYRIPTYIDLPALIELLSAALTLFALRAAHDSAPRTDRSTTLAPALDPASPAGWRRIEKTVRAVTRALLDEEAH